MKRKKIRVKEFSIIRAKPRKIGRNENCHCGSGLKSKKCCNNLFVKVPSLADTLYLWGKRKAKKIKQKINQFKKSKKK